MNLGEFAQDLYDVLGMNTGFCTQRQFFEKYVEPDSAFMVGVDKDVAIIQFDDVTITIKPINYNEAKY